MAEQDRTKQDAAWWEEDPRRRQAFEARYIGHKWERISKEVGVSRNTIHIWRQSPQWRAEFEARDKQAVELGREAYRTALRLLIEAGPVMVRRLLKLAHKAGPGQNVQLSATKDALDRAGLAFRPQADQGGETVADRVVKALSGEAEFERAQSLMLDAMGGEE